MILLIDNFDSFTFNLAALLRSNGATVVAIRNDQLTDPKVAELEIRGIVISPGPGRPADAGCCPAFVKARLGQLPMLGVCLGHQMLGELLGAKLVLGKQPVHGKVSNVLHTGAGVFANLPSPMPVMRYHSLVLENETLPTDLVPTAWTSENELMAFKHRYFPIEGVQFHPESILSPLGNRIIQNWLSQLSTLDATFRPNPKQLPVY